MYGYESWVPITKIVKQVKSSDIGFMRKTKACTRRDRLRNEDIRNEVQVLSIRIQSRNIDWELPQHLERMENRWLFM